jgi:transcriptional regulator with PAS, ATPase and Fis domain
MRREHTTLDDTTVSSLGSTDGAPNPGLVVVWSDKSPQWRVLPLGEGNRVVGRADVPDERVSRDHAEVGFKSGTWTVRDLGSRNGTFVDGHRVSGQVEVKGARILRIGHTLALLRSDVTAFARDGGVITNEKMVAGPLLREALDRIAGMARVQPSLLVHGDSGAGKELAARWFHSAGPSASGRFLAVNCATIPEGVAERLLFGAKRGAYSGATADATGFIEAAEGGVLFLDEIGELDLDVQAKLLRVVETREVIPLGASAPRKVDVRFCFATHRDLKAAVADGRFRADLYYRIAQPQIVMPPLRSRLEEIPYLMARALEAKGGAPPLHAKLVEECLLRPWPGNVRELAAAIGAAIECAQSERAGDVRRQHLPADAGKARAQPTPAAAAGPELRREDLEKALAENRGNLSAAARALGLHRTQLYRMLKKHGLQMAGE